MTAFRQEQPQLAELLQELLEEQAALEKEDFLAGRPIIPVTVPFAGQTVGAYRLISPIGEGGMGTVWLAERSDGRFERKVAIKFLRFSLGSQTGAERFKREGRILGKLTHPHIAELMDAGVGTTDQPYIVLEYIDCEQIDTYCDRHRLDVNTRIGLFIDVLSAVSNAHNSLIVHRDIKPSNVLVRNDGQVKLLDFGIAKLLDDVESGTAMQLTLEGASALTPQYATPEQVTGGVITTATDVYALGGLLYLLLTGRHPTGSGSHSPAQLIKAIVETEPIAPSETCLIAESETPAERRGSTPEKLHRELQGDLDTILGKALKKNPPERYLTVNSFADDLQRFLKHEPISARPDSFIYRASKFVQRNRAAVVLASLAILGTFAGLAGTVLQARTARAQRDFAFRQLARAVATSHLFDFVLSDAAPSGKPFTVNELLDRAADDLHHQPSGDEQTRVELLVSIGRQYSTQDEDAKAMKVLQEAYTLSKSLPDLSVRAETACNLAISVARSGDTKRAEDLFQEGFRELPRGQEFASIRADCLALGGELAEESGDINSAMARIQEAQHVSDASLFPDRVTDLTIAIDTANVYRQAGRNREALAAFARAAAILKSLGREKTENAVVLFNDWAYALNQLGRPLEAEKLYEQAMIISRDSDNDGAISPMVLNNYAKTLRNLGLLDKAAYYAEKACAKAKETHFEVAVNQSLLERSRIYRDQGDLARSGAMLAEVEPRLRQSLPPSHYAFAVLESEKAQYQLLRGDLKTALRMADDAVRIDEASMKSAGQGSDALPTLLYVRAAIEMKGKPDQAVADASRAIRLVQGAAEPGTFSAQLARCYLALGSAVDFEGKHDEARAAYRSAAENFQATLGPDHPDTRNARRLAELAQ
jgi:serine/threonine-protein kinase